MKNDPEDKKDKKAIKTVTRSSPLAIEVPTSTTVIYATTPSSFSLALSCIDADTMNTCGPTCPPETFPIKQELHVSS